VELALRDDAKPPDEGEEEEGDKAAVVQPAVQALNRMEQL
jgi:hypothetical protein